MTRLKHPQDIKRAYYPVIGSYVFQRIPRAILKEHDKQAKKNHLSLSLLIHNSNEASISALLKEPEKHAQNLITDIAPIMQKHGFTDLNLDIESFELSNS